MVPTTGTDDQYREESAIVLGTDGATPALRSVAVVVGGRVAAFELGILCQVFGLDRSDEGLPRFDFALCASTPGPVPTTSGFPVVVGHGLDRVAGADLVAVPAWPDLDSPVPPAVLDAVRAAVGRGARVLSICTGAYLLAAAGLLDGRRAATHWQYAERLARTYPRVRVDADVLYVEDGPIVTSAGAAAGIDAALHVLRRSHGTAVATAVARRMVVPPQRSGGQAQYVETPLAVATRPASGAMAEVLDWAAAHLDEALPVAVLAARAHAAPRTFARRFVEVTGTTPHRWLLDRRLELAERLLETTDLPVEAVAHRCGFGGADTLRHHFAARRGTSPTAYRQMFRGLAGAPPDDAR